MTNAESSDFDWKLYPDYEAELTRFQTVVDETNKKNTPEDTDPKSVFHYTSAETAIAILKSKALRFSEYRGMNDRFEVEFGKRFAKLASDGLRGKKDGIRDIFFNMFWKEMEAGYDKYFHFMVHSSATNPTSQVLWERYAENHAGVAFELKTDAIDEDGGDASYKTTRYPVRYGSNLIVSIQRKLTKQVVEALKIVSPHHDRDVAWAFCKRLGVEYGIGVLYNSLLFKSKQWEAENEYRFLIIGARELVEAHPRAWRGTMFGGYAGWRLDSLLKGASPILRIHLGTRCRSESVARIRDELARQRMDIELIQRTN
jgi:hypothetical protein